MKIIFAGTPEFAAVILESLIHSSHEIVAVYTQPDRPAGRGRKLHESPVKELALKNQLPVFQPEKLKEPIDIEADVMVVAAYGLLLPSYVLEAPKYGCLNVHASLLPRWRGAAPIHRAILAGDKETGITIMQMEKGLDTGPMLHKVKCDILSQDNTKTLHDKLAAIGAKALLEVLNNPESFPPEKQDDSLATYAKKIVKSETILDFAKPAVELERAVRAYYPAQAFINNECVKIWEAESHDKQTNLLPGTIIESLPQGIIVATAKGNLIIHALQLPGGKKLTVKEILNSKNNLFMPGRRLG